MSFVKGSDFSTKLSFLLFEETSTETGIVFLNGEACLRFNRIRVFPLSTIWT
jgi:hypothetical protein